MLEERRSRRSALATTAMIMILSSSLALSSQEAGRASKISGVEIGDVFEMWSKQLNEKRTYSVSLPSSYDQSKAEYPLVVILDGESYFALAVGVCRFMSMNRLMPEAVVVGLHNSDRRRDMTPPDLSLPDIGKGNGAAFLAFLEEELLPVLKSSYRLLPLRILVGHSHGGLIACYAISERPNLFRWYLLVDAPVTLGNGVSEKRLENFLGAHPGLTGKMISIERSFGWTDDSWRVLGSKAPKSFVLTRFRMPEETHSTMFLPALYEGLKRLFKDIMAREDGLTTYAEMKSRYDSLSEAYGYRVAIPFLVLMDAAEDQLMAGRPGEASDLVEAVKKQFGDSPETAAFEKWIKALQENPLEETYDQILASLPPTADQIKPFLGTWKAVIQSHSPNGVEITFEIHDGKAVARHREFDESGAEVTPILGNIAYLRMRDKDMIEWGYMNGMRPRTMIIAYTAKLDASGALTGFSAPTAVSFSPERRDHPGTPQAFKFVRTSRRRP
jgi:pimeloyl-ACP methyl ester carboxylesterase